MSWQNLLLYMMSIPQHEEKKDTKGYIERDIGDLGKL